MCLNPKNVFEEAIKSKVESIMYGSYDNLHNIECYSAEIASQILVVLLENACLGQNYAPIEIARRKISEINTTWLDNNIIAIASKCINWDDEWEFRRLAELVSIVIPNQLAHLLELGCQSTNPEVQEAIGDFSNDI